MSVGRFRVKSGIGRETAELLVADLESIGAVCTLEDETGRPIALAPARSVSQSEMQSGLAAAAYGSPGQDLGALATNSDGLALATLDGEDDRPAPGPESVAAFEPSAFAPPDAGEADLQLAVELNHKPAAPASMQPEHAYADDGIGPVVSGAAVPAGMDATNVPGAMGQPAMGMGSAPMPRAPSVAGGTAARSQGLAAAGDLARQGLARLSHTPRLRFAVGVFLVLLVGFLPAHVFGVIREGSVYSKIDDQVQAEQESVTDLEAWNALDDSRKAHLERKYSSQRSIALGSIVVWALFGGIIGFVWFRRIDWDEYRRAPG